MGGKGGIGKKARALANDASTYVTLGTVNLQKGKIASSTNEVGTNLYRGVTFKNTRDALSPSSATPDVAELPAAPDEAQVARDADQDLIERMRRNTGRSSTLLTGSMGLNSSGNLSRRSLMGS